MDSEEFRFIHAADLHLDTPFRGLSRTAPQVARAVEKAATDAFQTLVEAAIRERAAFVLFAGDIYDGCERHIWAQLRFRQGLEQLSRAGIQSFVVHGNHDPLGVGWPAVKSWPEGVHVFGCDDVETVPVVADGCLLATVSGISYGKNSSEENLALRFPRNAAKSLHIGLLHCNLNGNGEHELYSPCSTEDLLRSGFDYWALGHIHKRQWVKEKGAWLVYPGNLQGRSPKPAEQGAKGAVLVHVRGGGVNQVSFLSCDCLRYVSFSLDIEPFQDSAELQAGLSRELDVLKAEHPGKGLIVRAELRGRGVLHSKLLEGELTDSLLRELRETAEDEPNIVWWDRIAVCSRPVLDFAAIARRSDFSAELLRYARSLTEDEAAAESFLSVCFDPLARHRHSRSLRELGEESSEIILARAAELALGLLEEEGEE